MENMESSRIFRNLKLHFSYVFALYIFWSLELLVESLKSLLFLMI